ncbi:MAG: hypothetical protein J6U04_04670 [Salinivirgaceae bacterium]|nr:hypothetical protein [Salinivirgaceae bacterium]MBO7477210.1 hypothetical protein [Salinivirgaceae bacterium]
MLIATTIIIIYNLLARRHAGESAGAGRNRWLPNVQLGLFLKKQTV